jgi:hypothetical protein
MSDAQTIAPAPPFQALHFHVMSAAVAGVAALATFGTNAVMLPAPAMFLGWIAYSLGLTLRQGLANILSFLLGIAFGMGTATTITALSAPLGDGATPVAITGVVLLVLSLRTLAPINNPLAYFLGLTSFFYSGLAPTSATFATLAVAGLIGAGSAAVAGTLQTFVQNRGIRAGASAPA